MARHSKIAAAYRDVFSGPNGQVVLADIMAQCGVYAPIPPGDAMAMAYAEGMRNVALMIASHMAYKPSEFVQRATQHNRTLEHIIE
jgi:hypothetical protein